MPIDYNRKRCADIAEQLSSIMQAKQLTAYEACVILGMLNAGVVLTLSNESRQQDQALRNITKLAEVDLKILREPNGVSHA